MIVRFLGGHVILGALTFFSADVAKFHFWGTVAIAAWLVASTKRRFDIAAMAAYVVGAEVLWRMTRAALFWESGKYFVVVLFLFGLVRFSQSRSLRAPVAYFVLLLPGVMVLGQNALDADFIRAQTSFYLSGPLALAVAACFFRQVSLSKSQVGELCVAVLGPVVSIATVTVLSTYTSANIVFRASSNFEASGGFGPNQVSAALSLGALLCFVVLATQSELGFRLRSFLFTTLAVCAIQSVMTFSRSGLYMLALAMLGASAFLLGDRSGRRMVLGLTVALALISSVIAPELISFTGGAVAERFENVDTTGRLELLEGDLAVWAEQPLFGAGVGRAELRELGRPDTRTHTEWTRMVADHGVFGLVSLLILLAMMVGNCFRAPGPLEQAVVVSLVLWAAAYLSVNDMRVVAPSFLIGLSCATFQFPASWRPTVWRRRATP